MQIAANNAQPYMVGKKGIGRVEVEFDYSLSQALYRFKVRVLVCESNVSETVYLKVTEEVMANMSSLKIARMLQSGLPPTHIVDIWELEKLIVKATSSANVGGGSASLYVKLATNYDDAALAFKNSENSALYAAGNFYWLEKLPEVEYTVTESISKASTKLPGVLSKMSCPAREDDAHYCSHRDSTLWDVIQHLNDKAKWSREQIADWLDELHDSGQINIEFQPWNEGEEDEDAGKS